MKAEKLRDMNPDELRNEETRLVDQIFRLRFQIAASQAENPARVHLLRKDLARVKTILREKAGPASVAVKSTAAVAGAAAAGKPATGKAVAGKAAGRTEAVAAGSAKTKPARSAGKVGRQSAAKSGGTVKEKGAAKAKGAKQERG
ncbi:MAG TPA: 50S ribosomal protein L29 [Patescibacteria group bacterium]|nr:50S ribosomal protein L29 [Patescibacteria group bacterium]